MYIGTLHDNNMSSDGGGGLTLARRKILGRCILATLVSSAAAVKMIS
jgi:hypothetical protein